jgi:hypothetical protein
MSRKIKNHLLSFVKKFQPINWFFKRMLKVIILRRHDTDLNVFIDPGWRNDE